MRSLIFLVCGLVAVGCARDVRPGTMPTEFVDPGAADPVLVREAIAILHPASGSEVAGVVRFRVVAGERELEVVATIDGLSGGTHAYHVHVFGDCSAADATSAGPHLHFTGSSSDESVDMVTGNLGELRTNGASPTTHRARIPKASLHGPFSIVGRSVVVHEHGNNHAVTPDGGAGKRIACGVIGIATAKPTTTTRR